MTEKAKNKKDRYLYVVKCDKFYKIGITNNTLLRLSELQVSNPEKLEIIGEVYLPDAIKSETYWHKRFKKYNVRGEWFELDKYDRNELMFFIFEKGGDIKEEFMPKTLIYLNKEKSLQRRRLNTAINGFL